MKFRIAPLGIVLACSPLVPAQNNSVQINEVNYTTAGQSDQWIEIANFGISPMEMTNWSIYQATTTVGQAQNYWWPFPAGVTIPAGETIRVRWLHPVDAGNMNPRLIDTGDTVHHFLFGLFAEPLSREGGALALVASQNNLDMNTASFYRDFVAWGSVPGTFRREDLAAQNGRWTLGARVAQAPLDHSIALNSAILTEPTPPGAFFRDSSPTPLAANHRGDAVTPFGTNCILGVGQAPTLSVLSIPVPGNIDFAMVFDGLEPATGVLAMFLGVPAPQGLPWIQPPCLLWVDYTLPLISVGLVPDAGSYSFQPDLSGVLGVTFAIQGLVLRSNGLGFTSAATVRVSEV